MDEDEEQRIGNYQLFELIGKGTFATVWLGMNSITGTNVAVKEYPKNDISPDTTTSMDREIKIMRMLDHPFIADLFDVIENSRGMYLIMEYIENGTLLEKVNKSGPFCENEARMIFAQIVAVLVYLHEEKRIVHRDLKPENILIDENDNIRLIDFGLSNVLNLDTSSCTTVCGSPAYVAPEMLLDQPYTTSADIWSAGVLLFGICSGYVPFEDNNIGRLIQKVLADEPVYPMSFSPSLTDLIKKMLTKDPNKRISISGIKNHPWFTTDDSGKILIHNFHVLNQYKYFPDGKSFHGDEKTLEQLKNYGIDPSKIIEKLESGVMDYETASYKALFKEQMLERMTMIPDQLISYLPSKNSSMSALNLNRRVPLKSLLPQSNATDTQIGKVQGQKSPAGHVGSLPTINKIPSRGANGMQLINLIAPISSQNERFKVRSSAQVPKPQVITYRTNTGNPKIP